jgi:glycosyltransferase involved in cell wall biosynthesis
LIVPEETGVIVPVDDVAALAAALRRVLGDPALAARLADGGRRAYETGFTEAAVVSRYRDFFAAVTA